MTVEHTFDTPSETTTSLARLAGVTPETIRLYVKLGLIKSIELPNGSRIFCTSVAEKVKKIYEERMARRGGHHPAM